MHAQSTAVPAAGEYPTLRKTGRAALLVLLAFSILYYPVLSLAVETLIPLAGLFGIGILLGAALPRRAGGAAYALWLLVFLAAVLRRAATWHLPLGSQVFGGVLMGYPAWSIWLAEAMRLGIYYGALRTGASLGRRTRRAGRPSGGEA